MGETILETILRDAAAVELPSASGRHRGPDCGRAPREIIEIAHFWEWALRYSSTDV